MVWSAKDSDGDQEIFFSDGKETIQLTDNDVDDAFPKISGNNIVWTAKDSDSDQEIFLYNGEQTIQLTDNDVNDYSPQISDNNTVWVSGNDAFSRKILLFNGDQIIQLTNNHELFKVSPKLDSKPKIAGNKVVWRRENIIDNTASVMLAIIKDTESSLNLSSDRDYKIVTSSTIIILCLISLCFLKKLVWK